MTKWQSRFYSPDEDGNSGGTVSEEQSDFGGDAEDSAFVEEAAGDTTQQSPPPSPVKIKIGEEELTAEQAAAEIAEHRKARQSALMTPVVEDEAEEVDPDDYRARLDRIEAAKKHEAAGRELSASLTELQTRYGESFNRDGLIQTMSEVLATPTVHNFVKQIEMAHKAAQYDVLKSEFDAKLAAATETGVREALKKEAQRRNADVVHKTGTAHGKENDSWEGDPVAVAKRKGITLGES